LLLWVCILSSPKSSLGSPKFQLHQDENLAGSWHRNQPV